MAQYLLKQDISPHLPPLSMFPQFCFIPPFGSPKYHGSYLLLDKISDSFITEAHWPSLIGHLSVQPFQAGRD